VKEFFANFLRDLVARGRNTAVAKHDCSRSIESATTAYHNWIGGISRAGAAAIDAGVEISMVGDTSCKPRFVGGCQCQVGTGGMGHRHVGPGPVGIDGLLGWCFGRVGCQHDVRLSVVDSFACASMYVLLQANELNIFL